MKENKKIIILYSDGKYDLSAKAIKDYFGKTYSDADAVTVSSAKVFGKLRVWFARKAYVFLVRNVPNFYGWFDKIRYVLSRKKPKKIRTSDGSKQCAVVSRRKMRNLIKRFNPQVIVATTPKLLAAAFSAREALKKESHIKLVALMSDFAVDKRMLAYGADAYFVENSEAVKYLTRHGVVVEKITNIGLPLPVESFKEYDEADVKKRLGIANELPIIVVAGGRYGNGNAKKLFSYAVKLNSKFNIILVAGDSGTLSNCVKKAQATYDSKNIFVAEKLDGFAEILSIAEIAALTPTAAMLSEAMAKLIPVIVGCSTGYLESKNARYLLSNNFVLSGADETAFSMAVKRITGDKRFKSNMIENMVRFTDTDAASRAGDALYRLASSDNTLNDK